MRESLYTTILTICGLAVASVATAADDRFAPKSDAQLDLKTAIPAAIEMLERKEYERVVLKYVHSKDLKKVLEYCSMAEITEGFEKGSHDDILKMLRRIQHMRPLLDDRGVIAVYRFDGEYIRWKKIHELWFIVLD